MHCFVRAAWGWNLNLNWECDMWRQSFISVTPWLSLKLEPVAPLRSTRSYANTHISQVNSHLPFSGKCLEHSSMSHSSLSTQWQYWAKTGSFHEVCRRHHVSCRDSYFSVGWSSSQSQIANAAFQQSYDQSSYGAAQGDIGMKARLIDLISAVRTLMRSMWLVIYREQH